MGTLNQIRNGNVKDKILYSSYKAIPVPTDKRVVELILEMANHNIQNGKVNWVVRFMDILISHPSKSFKRLHINYYQNKNLENIIK